MSKLFNTILFSTTLLIVSFNQGHTSSKEVIDNECVRVWDLASEGNTLDMNLSNEEWQGKAIILKNSGKEKIDTVYVTGNNSEAKSVVITPPDVKKVIFDRQDSFTRTINISGNTLSYTFK